MSIIVLDVGQKTEATIMQSAEMIETIDYEDAQAIYDNLPETYSFLSI